LEDSIFLPKSDEISRIWDPNHHPDLGNHFKKEIEMTNTKQPEAEKYLLQKPTSE